MGNLINYRRLFFIYCEINNNLNKYTLTGTQAELILFQLEKRRWISAFNGENNGN